MLDYIHQYANWGWDGMTGFIIPFIIVLSVLVFVHEWGHYIVARMCGVRVEKFSIGFGKELFGYTDKAGTRWKFSLIPLGGYVQMFGDEDPASAKTSDKVEEGEVKRVMTAEEKKVAFFNKPVWQRAAIVFAGPAINFLFAIVLLMGVYIAVGKPVNPPVAAAIIVGGAADEAGLIPHDRIIAIDGKTIESFSEIQRQVAISLDRTLSLTVLRNGEEIELTVTPKVEEMEDRFGFSHSRGMIGMIGAGMAISYDDIQTVNGREVSDSGIDAIMDRDAIITLPWGNDETRALKIQPLSERNMEGDRTLVLTEVEGRDIVKYSAPTAMVEAVRETWFMITGTLEGLGQIITGTRSTDELGGIIRIGAIAGDAASAGIVALITFMAMLSINLGLINLFPIPLLDGGHLVFYAYEALFKKPMPEKVMEYALKFGLVFLVCLMAFANLNDIIQLIM
jgi:regulator of sigma E protease